MNAARWIFVGLLLAAIGQAIVYYPQLPERMASHFNARGVPDAYTLRTAFFTLQGFVIVVVVAAFGILPALIQHLPVRLINLPNKGYWLAPERREETMAGIGAALTWFGCVVLAFILFITWLVIRFNLGSEPALPGPAIWAALATLVVCVVLLTLRLLYLGRRPPG